MPIKPHRGGGLSYNYLLRKANYCYQTNSDPTVNNDGVDTAGIGRRFRVEDTWQNTTSDDFWIVRDIATGAAVWEKYALAHGATGNFIVSNGTLWGPSINTWACAATDIVGEALVNTTAATAETTSQYSPIFKLGGTAHKSNAPAASQTQDWGLRVKPVTGTTSTTSSLQFLLSDNGAAYSAAATITSIGQVQASYIEGGVYCVAGGVHLTGIDMAVGFNATGLRYNGDYTLTFNNLGKTDAASGVVIASVYDRNAASITNASTMRIHSFGWTNNSDVYNELAYVRADGAIVGASGSLLLGIMPTGLSNDFGISTVNTTDTLSIWGTRANGPSNVSVAVIADVNAAAINSSHKAFQVGWVNDSDAFTELMSVSDGALQLTSAASAKVLSTEVDNPSVVAVTVGTENVFTLPVIASGLHAPRATLLSVVNGSPGNEKFAVDVTGNTCMNEGENGQSACFKSLSELLTITTGTSYTDTAAAIIPSGCICYAVSTKPISPILSGITYDVGVSGATTRYGTKLSAATGTSWRGTDDGPRFYGADAPVRITPSVTLGATGTTRVTIHYVEITAPTS